MAEAFEITRDMWSTVGVWSDTTVHEVTTTSVRAFARGVGYVDPVYYDEQAAIAAGYASLPAPPTYLGTPIFAPAGTEEDERTARRPRLDHGLPRVLDGGTEITYMRDIVAGDVLKTRTAVVDLATKVSNSLGVMLITTIETQFRDSSDTLVAQLRSQFLYY